MEFFADLDRESRNQVWGVTFDYIENGPAVPTAAEFEQRLQGVSYEAIARAADRWVRRDRAGAVQAELAWDDARLGALIVAGYDHRALRVDGAVVAHPVLGATHALTVGGVEVARMTAIDWRRPTAIPAIDRPAALPPGTGTMVLDTIARLARDAGVRALRYAGPYPTAALWASLGASFRADGDEAAFTAAAHGRWGGGALPPIPIDFAPAPHERVPVAPDACAHLRDGIERVVVAGASFARGGGVRRLIDVADGVAAELWFGDRPWARVAELGLDAAIVRRLPPPPADAAPAGQALPPALVLFTSMPLPAVPSTVALLDTLTFVVKVGAAPSGGTPAFQIGLVRSFWQEVPVGTNAMYAPDYQAAVDADVKLNHQVVSEAFRSGRGVVVTNSPR